MTGNLSSLNFDANTVDTSGNDFDPIPNGEYPVMAVASEMRPTKAGTGQYLQLELEVMDGPYKGRKVWDRLNLDNPNEKAVQIAKAQFAALCTAVGVPTPQDSSQLHNRPVIAKVRVSPARDGYDASNDVKGYKAIGGAPAQAAAPAAPPAAAGAADTGKPWEK